MGITRSNFFVKEETGKMDEDMICKLVWLILPILRAFGGQRFSLICHDDTYRPHYSVCDLKAKPLLEDSVGFSELLTGFSYKSCDFPHLK